MRYPAALVAALAACTSTLLFAVVPTWWQTRGVLTPGAEADDFAVLNAGQLRQLQFAASSEMQARLGSAPPLPTVSANQDNFAAITIGQLKAAAKPYYQKLAEAGQLSGLPPWFTTPGTDDFAAANLGQAKQLFSFGIGAIEGSSDGAINQQQRNALGLHDSIADADADGVNDLQELLEGSLSPGGNSNTLLQGLRIYVFTPGRSL